MSRPLRLQFPGALFHVTCRGNAQQTIFYDDADRKHFLMLLGCCVKRFGWILPAYVLMQNHFHFVVQLTIETLSRGMQWLNGEYAKHFNQRHERVGHLFQGRPHMPLIEKETYYLDVLRYVVLNPVRAHIVARPEDSEWTSHRAVIGKVEAPDWLAVDDVLANFGDNREVARERYRCFVDAGIGRPDRPWDHLVGQLYLGTEEWVDRVRERIELKPRADEHPRAQRIVATPAMIDVVSAVASVMCVDRERVRQDGLPRLIAAWIGRNEALLTNRQIAAGLRLRSEAYIPRLVRDCDAEIDAHPMVRECIDRSISTLRGKSYRLQA